MDTESSDWWRRHGWTVGLLLVAFGLALTLRVIWQYPVIQQFGALYTYAGGSDSYYHSRVMTYIVQDHRNLVFDPMLKYPVGAINPREPLFDWMNAVLGIVFAPFFGGNAVSAGAFFLDLQAPLWAALAVFPIYLIGREASGRRTGLIAALVYPFFSGNIDFTTFGYADYQSFYTFFLLVVIYAFLRTLKAVGHRRWIESSRDPRQLLPAARAFLGTERTTVKWAVFTGVSLGAFGLAWQGYSYAIVVIIFTVLVAMVIEQIRHVDSFGLYVSTWVIGLVAFAMVSPYYIVQGEFRAFLELPILLYFGALVLLLPFLLMRDFPWVFSIPTLVAVVGAGVLALRIVSPVFFAVAITGNGYFVKTLVYSTVAEAQAPSIDALIVGYGVVTFFLAFAGLALFGFQLVRQRFKRYLLAVITFSVVSIYLPITASKFFPVAAPAFALLAAEGIHRLLDVGGYPQLRRAVASLTDRKGSLAAFRKSFKARHVLVLALAVGILLPNIWIAIDAGIPSNTKTQAAVQINNTIPSWLKLNRSAPASDYLGAAGTGLDTSNEYDSAGYNWLAQQDTNIPEPQRPAVVAWWDYGFQTIDQGQHPSVADNFQNGIDPAGQFLLSQNESLAIGILATTLLQGEILSSHDPTLPASLNAMLTRDGVNVTALHHDLDDEKADYNLVVGNPQTYLPVNPSTLTDDNAMYLATSYYLASHLSLAGVAQVYDGLEAYTGWSIGYAMTDSRTFPFSGSDTGIFYAPADLTGRVINAEGVPTSFFNVTILGSDGNTYPLGPLPAGVSATEYNIAYEPAFYDTMLYRIYIGYNGTDVGQSTGIPGLTGALESDPIEPGWMLQHFEVVYETAYACRGVANASAGSGCFTATNRPTAITVANRTHGTDDLSSLAYFQGGESILTYYPGVTLYGRVALPDGQPVPGVRATIYDSWGIPHMTNLTTSNGTFSLVLPPGNDTLNLTFGKFNPMTQADANPIASIHLPISRALGMDTSAPSLLQTFTVLNSTVAGQVYWNLTGNGAYVPSSDPVVRGAQVVLSNSTDGLSLTATTDPSGTFALSQVPPGTYDVAVRLNGQTYVESGANVSAGVTKSLSLGLSPGTINGTVTVLGYDYPDATVTLTNSSGGSLTTSTNATGRFNFTGLAVGTYGISAAGPGTSYMSGVEQVAIPKAGAKTSVNLTVELGGAAQVEVEENGLAVPNASVTFAPLPSFASRSFSAVNAVLAASTNATFASTGANGVAAAEVPVGAYTVVAQARAHGALQTALGTLNVLSAGATASLVLNLTPAYAVNVSVPGAAVGGIRTAVLAYNGAGAEVTGWAALNGSTDLDLPAGSFTFLAVQGSKTASTSKSSPSVGLVSASVTGPTSLAIALGSSVTARFSLGTPGPGEEILAASNATVGLSVGPGGPSVRAVAAQNGSVGFVVPSLSPSTSGGYCLSASAFGFVPATRCGLSSAALANLTTFDLTTQPVAVTLGVVGLPAQTPVTVNITGETVGTTSLSLTGGPGFAFSLPPGVYGIGARAVIGHGTAVYLPSSVLTTTIPLGATYSNLTLVVVPEINASGALKLPAGVTAASTTVALASPLLDVKVNGTAYTTSFRATPATYTATVTATLDGATYVNVSRVTLYPNGTLLPRLVLSQPGVTAQVTLTQPSGKTLPVNTTVSLVTPGGLVVQERSVSGMFSATIPAGTYRVLANATASASGPNGTYLVNWTAAASAACTISSSAADCGVPMVGTVVTVSVHGTLVVSGGSSRVPGTVQLLGPYPSKNLTVVTATSGTFSATLLPGAYDVYAASTPGVGLAAFGRLLALPSAPLNVTIPLVAAWTDALLLSGPSGAGEIIGPANVSVADVFGDVTTFSDVALGTTLDLVLPAGTYTIAANASGSLNGVSGTATASAKVPLVSGNLLTTLALSVPVQATVSASVVGSSSATVAAGGRVTFALTVHNTGNVPVTVHPVGAPATWGFRFSFANATLAPGASLSAEVLVTVPAGTLVAHGPVSLVLDLPNGTEAGAVSPAPTVTVLPYYGLVAGTSSSSPPEVGSSEAVLPFYVVDTGNTAEEVRLSVVDSAHLAFYGWTTRWATASSSTRSGYYNLSAGQNLSVSLNLTATSSIVLPPGPVTVEVSVVNGSGALTREVLLAFPRPTVSTAAGSLVVTGPSVGSAPSSLPAWFVPLVAFVPALLLIVVVVTYRWWRTRRWTRW